MASRSFVFSMLEVARSSQIWGGRTEVAVVVRCGAAIGSTGAHGMLIAAPFVLLAGILRAAIMSGTDSVVDGIVLVGTHCEAPSPSVTMLSAAE